MNDKNNGKGLTPTALRRRNLDTALGILKRLEKANFRKAKALISYNMGVQERKAVEYIKILRDAGFIDISGGFVVPLYKINEDVKA